MKTDMKSKLGKLQVDYTQIQGRPFNHFYCPILFKDENVPLCRAHIVNRSFPSSSRNWTVQRKDVDSFYGSKFEDDFVAILYSEHRSPGKVLTDKKLSQRFHPRILIDEEPIEYFVAKSNVPGHFTPVEFHHEGQSIQLGLKMSPENASTAPNRRLEIEIDKDVRIAALVSLIKAAHLTLFDMIGYRYALSGGGYFVGRQILGKFFYQNHDKPRSKVLQNAHSFFREFVHLVRPIQSIDLDLRGTISDRKLFVCSKDNHSPWALIVFVRISRSLHAVMIPVFDQPDAVATFLGFLRDQNETIEVSLGCFEQDHWDTRRLGKLIWPKTGVLYP